MTQNPEITMEVSNPRVSFALWSDFLDECANLIEGENKWETINLNGQHSKQKQETIINELFIKNATLPQIVRRHRLYNKNIR
tara:strand:+ start:6 stop:251 length:246 start_codon:yes stop_codon:yes gene_type:complete